MLVWAGPAQVILVSTLGAGASLFEVAVAVGLSGVRLLPMVVAMLPMLKRPGLRSWKLLLPAHFTAVSMWVEALRLFPQCRARDASRSCNGLGTGYTVCASAATLAGYYLAARMPTLISAALLFLTPLAFLMSTLRNARMLVDRLALGLGLVLGPLFAYWQIGLDLMWSGIVGRHRGLCGASRARGAAMSALSGEFAAYLALVLVGLPAERGVALARR